MLVKTLVMFAVLAVGIFILALLFLKDVRKYERGKRDE